jgi:hypothetical protein
MFTSLLQLHPANRMYLMSTRFTTPPRGLLHRDRVPVCTALPGLDICVGISCLD